MEKKESWTQYLTWSRVMLVLYILILVCAFSALFLVQHFLPAWHPWESFEGLIFPDYNCENVTLGFFVIRQPISAVSSFFFLLVGIYMITSMIHDYAAKRKVRTLTVNFDSDEDEEARDVEQHVSLSYESVLAPDESLSPVVSFPFISGTFGFLCTYVGTGVFLYHACDCSLGERIVVGSIIGIFPFLVGIILFSVFPKCGTFPTHYIFLPVSLIWSLVSLAWVELYKMTHSHSIFPLQMVGIAVVILLYVGWLAFHIAFYKKVILHLELFLLSFIAVTLAGMVWLLEESIDRHWVSHMFCISPLRSFQYLGAALALLFFYFYFRTISYSHMFDSIAWRSGVSLEKFTQEENLMRPLMTDDDPRFEFEL